MSTPTPDDEPGQTPPQPSGGPWLTPLGWGLLITIALLCCGGTVAFVRMIGNRVELSNAGSPVVAPEIRPIPTPSWSPSPPRDEDFDYKLRYKLESGVLAAARVPAPVSSECATVVRRQASFPCSVTYAGMKVTFTVDITDVNAGGLFGWVEYRITAHEVLVTREAALYVAAHEGWRNYRVERCDEIPEISVVKVGAKLAQSCYYKRPHEPRRLVLRATRFWDGPVVEFEDTDD
jgi:hypothetical protein